MNDPLGSFPSAERVTEEFNCARALCQTPEECWVAANCLRALRPDVKGEKRKVDRSAVKRKLLSDPECRGCGNAPSDGHHIVFRSKGGDDVEDNIAPLCHDCHMKLHFGVGEEVAEIRRAIGESFTDTEIEYVLNKLGAEGGRELLARVYHRAVQ